MTAADLLRADLQLVISLVAPGSRVLDLGCGDGSLIAHLRDERGCYVRGIEVLPEEIAAAAVFLASDDSSAVVGDILVLNSGRF